MILELDYLPKSKNEYLSHNSPFFFSDVDFDGEEELIINNWKCGIRHCNTYDVYKITNNEVKQLTEAPFVNPTGKISNYNSDFDSVNKTITIHKRTHNDIKKSAYSLKRLFTHLASRICTV